MRSPRTDLAIEICEDLERNHLAPDGIECIRNTEGIVPVETVRILNSKGEAVSGKPRGTYVTINTGRLWLDSGKQFRKKVSLFREALRALFPEDWRSGTVLVAGLGNRHVTADAIGPAAVKNLIVTGHIRRQRPALFRELGLADLCALTPGVLGETGMESAHVIRSVAETVRPSLILAVDALAGRELSRLVSTVQLCDSGIRPGSGVGNERPGLIPEELGIPVISIGVPTVVDAATLAADAISQFSREGISEESIRKKWSENGLNFFVTPKETDQIIQVMGSFIGYGINLAVNKNLSYEDMLSLIG